MHTKLSGTILAVLWTCTLTLAAGTKPTATIATIEGKASVLAVGAGEWKDARPNMPLRKGDTLYTREESFVEVRFADGAVLRMSENSKIMLAASTDKAVKTETSIGNVWVNMQKLAKAGKGFELSSPTAVAAIRGTVFQMQTGADSSTSVAVFDGTVAVGPSTGLKKQLDADNPPQQPGEMHEVPGPEEVPGPYEVSLEEWRNITAGQRIAVRKDGKFAEEKFSADQAAMDAFVKKNLELDKRLLQEKK